MSEVIEWLRSPEGMAWSRGRIRRLHHQGHRIGAFADLDLVHEYDCRGACWKGAYRPWTPEILREDGWIFEPESVEGLSSPA